MRIRGESLVSGEILFFRADECFYRTLTWPTVEPGLALEAVCGTPIDGFYLCHEYDLRVISNWLSVVSALSKQQCQILAIANAIGIRGDWQRKAIANAASTFFKHTYAVDVAVAMDLVRLNMGERCDFEG